MQMTEGAVPPRERTLVREVRRLAVARDGDRLVLQTGPGAVRQARRRVQTAGAVAALAGLALAWLNPWAPTFTALALLTLVLVHTRLRAVPLVTLDPQQGVLTVCQRAAGAGVSVALSEIAAVRGAYETQGWEPRSVIAVECRDAPPVPVVLPGTDEALAEEACRTLGTLLGCPAAYAGPFGGVTTWPESAPP